MILSEKTILTFFFASRDILTRAVNCNTELESFLNACTRQNYTNIIKTFLALQVFKNNQHHEMLITAENSKFLKDQSL